MFWDILNIFLLVLVLFKHDHLPLIIIPPRTEKVKESPRLIGINGIELADIDIEAAGTVLRRRPDIEVLPL